MEIPVQRGTQSLSLSVCPSIFNGLSQQPLQIGAKLFYIFLLGGPAGAQAHSPMGFVHPLLLAEDVFLRQPLQNAVRQDREQLVGGALHQERNMQGTELVPEPVRQPVGAGSDFKIQVILQ